MVQRCREYIRRRPIAERLAGPGVEFARSKASFRLADTDVTHPRYSRRRETSVSQTAVSDTLEVSTAESLFRPTSPVSQVCIRSNYRTLTDRHGRIPECSDHFRHGRHVTYSGRVAVSGSGTRRKSSHAGGQPKMRSSSTRISPKKSREHSRACLCVVDLVHAGGLASIEVAACRGLE